MRGECEVSGSEMRPMTYSYALHSVISKHRYCYFPPSGPFPPVLYHFCLRILLLTKSYWFSSSVGIVHGQQKVSIIHLSLKKQSLRSEEKSPLMENE